MGGAAPGPGLRLIDQPVHRTNRTKSYGARNPPTETVGESGPKFLSSRVSRPWLPAVSRPNAPEPRRFRRVRSWTPVCRKAGGGAEGNRTPDLLNAIQALSQLSYGPVHDIAGPPRPGRRAPRGVPSVPGKYRVSLGRGTEKPGLNSCLRRRRPGVRGPRTRRRRPREARRRPRSGRRRRP